MGGACSTTGRDDKTRSKCWSENMNGRDHSEDLGVEGKIISEWMSWK